MLSLSLFSCDDIFEEDIENKVLTIVSPISGTVIESNVVNFKWEALEGATKYRLQVFDDIDDKLLDTLISGKLNLVYPLEPGNYTWKARGENFAYQSEYSDINSFSVIETLDLTNQQVLLQAPLNDIYTKGTTLNCTWKSLNAATSYDFELFNITSNQTVVQNNGLTTTSNNLTNSNIATEAKYQWKVKAKNSTSETPFFSRTFYIDRTLPNVPNLTSPVNNSSQTINQSISFNWNSGTDTGVVQSPITYTFEISNSSSFGNIIFTTKQTSGSLQRTFNSGGEYYWRIKSIDAANNESSYSTVFKFTIN